MIEVVVGGQFGSEGKGHVTAQLVHRLGASNTEMVLVRVGGPNAGHSAIDRYGRKWALRQIPVGAVINTECPIVLGAGSEIDLEVLDDEVTSLEDAGIPILNRLQVDASATIIEPAHRADEQANNLTARVGSTGKGIGAARADRIWRTAPIFDNFHMVEGYAPRVDYGPVVERDTAEMLQEADYEGVHVIIEGTQGYGLGFHTEYYPYATSSDCTAQAFMAMVGILPVNGLRVWIVYRTYPIRVAGHSGPLYRETTWEALADATDAHIQPERTTVTQKVRRVGHWDDMLATKALLANGAPPDWRYLSKEEQRSTHIRPCLMFCDYIDPSVAYADRLTDIDPEMFELFTDGIGAPAMYGTGPAHVIWDVPV